MSVINSETSFQETVDFCSKYFKNVSVIENEKSHLAHRSQNFYKIIQFENRSIKYSIIWNYAFSELVIGSIENHYEKTALSFEFTKMAFDDCCPMESGNNKNVVFWSYELVSPHDDMPVRISALRLPIGGDF